MENIDITEKDGGVILSNFDSFDVEQTLECGQCFRFTRLEPKDYEIVAMGRRLRLTQTDGEIRLFPCSRAEFSEVWADYFDLSRDYAEIKRALSADDEVMRRAAEFGGGIRILNQDRLETLVSFIISQNKQIPGIKKIISDLSAKYGREIGGAHAFPSLDALRALTVEDFAALRTGFRARYLADAIARAASGEVRLDYGPEAPAELIRERLTSIKGVGPKVSGCVLLFSFGRRESFPVDVWVRRVVETLYFGGESKPEAYIERWAAERFGSLGGYAQQYLFYYARSLRIGGKR
ncbi:MAG: N-glycosylase [Clostridiales bacterium]|jgi:N-glycosylase/DNA lyase|nr:N-glycosylase [Clostridiales bacterium]